MVCARFLATYFCPRLTSVARWFLGLCKTSGTSWFLRLCKIVDFCNYMISRSWYDCWSYERFVYEAWQLWHSSPDTVSPSNSVINTLPQTLVSTEKCKYFILVKATQNVVWCDYGQFMRSSWGKWCSETSSDNHLLPASELLSNIKSLNSYYSIILIYVILN